MDFSLGGITKALSSILGGEADTSKDFSWASLIPSIIQAGTTLSGSYFQQSGDKRLAEQYAQQQAAQIAADKEIMDKKIAADKEMAAMAAGASVKAAGIAAGAQKKNTLANLYNNWAALTERGGEALQKSTSDTADNATRGLVARASVLR